MELLSKIDDFANLHQMFPSDGLILVGVSGGADSMCLLAALCELAPLKGFTIAAAHFNHMLRGSDADKDEAFVKSYCQSVGIPFYTDKGNVRALADQERLGIEEAARRMRYEFFSETAKKYSAARIATAHTADDNAETVLINLTRGTGLNGLGGIPPKRGDIIRPMLTVTRREVLDYLAQHSIGYIEDASNSLDIYNRNRIRHHVVPVLKHINPRFAESVALTASLLREDEEYLSSLADFFIAEHCHIVAPELSAQESRSLDVAALLALPRPVSTRVIRRMSGTSLSAHHVADIMTLCVSPSPSGGLSLPNLLVHREYSRIVFTCLAAVSTFAPLELQADATAVIQELGLAVTCRKTAHQTQNYEKINNSFTTFLFKYDSVCGNIVIRPRQTGDKIELFSGGGTKTLKKLFIERRIPARQRARIPVIADDVGILGVFGIGSDKRAASKAGDTILEIIFKETRHEE